MTSAFATPAVRRSRTQLPAWEWGCPTHREADWVGVSRAAPDRWRYRRSLPVTWRSERPPPLIDEVPTRSMQGIVSAPYWRSTLNLAVEVIRRQPAVPVDDTGDVPALPVVAWGGIASKRKKYGGVLVIPGVEAGGRARIGPRGHSTRWTPTRTGDRKGESMSAARSVNTRARVSTTVLTVGVRRARPPPSRKGWRANGRGRPPR